MTTQADDRNFFRSLFTQAGRLAHEFDRVSRTISEHDCRTEQGQGCQGCMEYFAGMEYAPEVDERPKAPMTEAEVEGIYKQTHK